MQDPAAAELRVAGRAHSKTRCFTQVAIAWTLPQSDRCIGPRGENLEAWSHRSRTRSFHSGWGAGILLHRTVSRVAGREPPCAAWMRGEREWETGSSPAGLWIRDASDEPFAAGCVDRLHNPRVSDAHYWRWADPRDWSTPAPTPRGAHRLCNRSAPVRVPLHIATSRIDSMGPRSDVPLPPIVIPD